jgi:hypothetical protein
MCYTDYFGTFLETAVFVDYKIKSCISTVVLSQNSYYVGDRLYLLYSGTKDYVETPIKFAKDVGFKKIPV